MTALPAAKREALRYRIWAFAAPREWNVTIKEIAEALDEPVQVINGALQGAGWLNRVRATFGGRSADGDFRAGSAMRGAAHRIVRDVLAGRVGAEFPA